MARRHSESSNMLRSLIAFAVLVFVSGCHRCGETRLLPKALKPFHRAQTSGSFRFNSHLAYRVPFSLKRTRVSQCSAVVENQTNNVVSLETKTQTPESKSNTPPLPTANVESNSPNKVPIFSVNPIRNLESNNGNLGSGNNLEANRNLESSNNDNLDSNISSNQESNISNIGSSSNSESNNEPLENRKAEPTQPTAIPDLELPTSEDILQTRSAAALTIDPSVPNAYEPKMLAVDNRSSAQQNAIRIVADRDRSLDLFLESLPQPAAGEKTGSRITQADQSSDTTPIADSETKADGLITQDVCEFEELPVGRENAVAASEVTLHARAVQLYQAPLGNEAQMTDLDLLLPTIPSKPLDFGRFDDTRFLADIDNNWRFAPLPRSWPFADGTRHQNSASASSEYEFTPLPKLIARESNPIGRDTSGISANLQQSTNGSVTDVIVDLIAPQLDTNPATAARPIQKPGDRR